MASLIALLFAAGMVARAESGVLTIHLILHAVGEERYEVTPAGGLASLTSKLEYTDRSNKRTASAELVIKPDYGADGFPIASATPFAVQMMMMRYWQTHGRPAQLARSTPANAPPIEIVRTGADTIEVDGKPVPLERFNVSNLMFGREILWMDAQGNLAAAMTFAGGLPMEAIRKEYAAALPQLYRSGVAQELANLQAIAPAAERAGAYAIVGARLMGRDDKPVVIVRNGRIAAIGGAAVPEGMAIIDARGKTVLPGLWEMHTHYSGVEFGPALLAAGITTARDCGGEFDFLVAQRDAIEQGNVPAPRLLLAGLVDAGGIAAFGHITAETPDEGRAVVKRYHDAGFQQIKLYTYLQPDVIHAITAEAHRLNMTVTGHVPKVFDAFEGVEAGMDQINHLNYVSTEAARARVEFFKEHHTVIDPTASWGEMASHSKEVDPAGFEPGILKAPFVLEAKFRAMGSAATADQMAARRAQTLAVIGALHKAGVAIIPGSDTGLAGYGLHRELELYVEAGMTPIEAIQSATIVSARAMHLEADSGTIEVGKRADMILVEGDPLSNIRDLRNVARVIASGRVYDPGKLWRSVGFRP